MQVGAQGWVPEGRERGVPPPTWKTTVAPLLSCRQGRTGMTTRNVAAWMALALLSGCGAPQAEAPPAPRPQQASGPRAEMLPRLDRRPHMESGAHELMAIAPDLWVKIDVIETVVSGSLNDFRGGRASA